MPVPPNEEWLHASLNDKAGMQRERGNLGWEKTVDGEGNDRGTRPVLHLLFSLQNTVSGCG